MERPRQGELSITKPLPVPPNTATANTTTNTAPNHAPRKHRQAPVIIDLSEHGGGRELRRRRHVGGSGSGGSGEGPLPTLAQEWSVNQGTDSGSSSMTTTSTAGSSIVSSTTGSSGSGNFFGDSNCVEAEDGDRTLDGGRVRHLHHHHHHHYFIPVEAGGDVLLDPATVMKSGNTTPFIEEYDDEDAGGGGGSDGGAGSDEAAGSGEEWSGIPAGGAYASDSMGLFTNEGGGSGWGGTADRVLEEFYRRHGNVKPVGAATWANPVPQQAFQNPTIANHCAWICSCVLYCTILGLLSICVLIFFGILTFAQVFGDPW